MIKYFYYIYWLLRTLPMRWNFPKYNVMSFEEMVNEIIGNKKSLTRFGDGEFRLLLGERDIVFQKLTSSLSDRLVEVINSKLPNLIVAIPESFISRKNLKRAARVHWLSFINIYGKEISGKIKDENRKFGNSFISRFYQDYSDKSEVAKKVSLLKKIWQDQNILFVEGEYSRLGIGNDLFANAKSVQRIICPSENAFEKYEKIFAEVKLHGKDKLIILALGPTATVLAHDLASEKFWALDLGHIDVEYSWFLHQAKNKVPVKGKRSAEGHEVQNYELGEDDMTRYRESIIAEIL